jgi:hypothetical protein
MEIGLRTPLIDMFRRGEVARDVRLLAAQGGVAPTPLEQIGLLALLSDDQEGEVRVAAQDAIAKMPVEFVSRVIARSDVPRELREFYVARGIPVSDSALDDETANPFDEAVEDLAKEPASEQEQQSMLERLGAMTLPQRVKAAMKGTREVRAVLIRDPNKIVALAVLSSPKVNEAEIESFCRMGNVGEDVLRVIANHRAWTKNYTVVSALVKHPKTPVAMTLPLLNRLTERDLKGLTTNHNVPEVIRLSARKKVREHGS